MSLELQALLCSSLSVTTLHYYYNDPYIQSGTPPCFLGSIQGQSQTENGDDPHSQSGTPPCFKALCGKNPEQNAGTIHESNPEHLPFLSSMRGRSRTESGDNPCKTISLGRDIQEVKIGRLQVKIGTPVQIFFCWMDT